MPLPSHGRFPLTRPALQQFLEGSTTRLLQSHLSVAPAILLLHRSAKRVGAVPAWGRMDILTAYSQKLWKKRRACTVGSTPASALVPAAPNNQWCCSPSESTIVVGAPRALPRPGTGCRG